MGPVEVLATTRLPVVPYYHISNQEVDMPVAWTKFWGNGRVFYNSLGHHDDVFDKFPEAENLMEQGMLWAAEGKQYAQNHGLTTEKYESTAKAALLAGKHVYSEKPLAAAYEQGCELVSLTGEKGLLLGGAPDTFLGAGIQTCRSLIDDGYIGRPIGAEAQMKCHGHESWHPSPAFYYQEGGGPMMDMGTGTGGHGSGFKGGQAL